MSPVLKNASESFCVGLMLDLIFAKLGSFQNVFIAFSSWLLYSWEISGRSKSSPSTILLK